MARYLKFEDISFYNLSVYHYNLHDKQNCVITGSGLEGLKENMINIEEHDVDFQCPNCDFYNTIKLKQARFRDVIICRGCKANIRLDDQMNETKKAIRSIKRAMNELEQTLNGLSFEIRI